jgi:hypothetical protein
MPKSRGLNIAKKLILSGDITNLTELLEVIDKTPLAREMKTSPERLNKLLDNPALFLFQDAYNIAALIGVDEKLILDIVHNQYIIGRKSKKKG